MGLYFDSMVPLNYNQLYYFYQIAETGSLVLASKKVLISSPALSMQLKELEESFGTPLFNRTGKKLVLTEAGTIVHAYARDIFKLGDELKDTLSDRGTEKVRGKIEIGCQDTIPKAVADSLITFLIEKKNCRVIVREGSREKLIQMQNEYKLDLILTNSLPNRNEHTFFEQKLLLREKVVMVGHPKFKETKKDWPKLLTDQPMILPTYDSSFRQKIDAYFKLKKITPDIVAEVQDKATEIDLALKGFGMISATKSSVKNFLESKELVELGPIDDETEEIWLLAGKRKILNPLALFALNNFSF